MSLSFNKITTKFRLVSVWLPNVTQTVTILGDLLHFGQVFKVCGNNYLAQIALILKQFFKGVNIFHFSSEIIFGQLL